MFCLKEEVFGEGIRMSSMGAEAIRKTYFFTYIVTARRRVGWVGDTLPFCAVLLLSVCFSDRKLLWFNPHREFFSGLDATVS